jgi:hypothetical protein
VRTLPAAAVSLVGAALLALAGCAGRAVDPDAPIVVQGLAIGPFATHAECLAATDGDRIDYTFDSSEPLRFGLRYREGGASVFPIEHDAIRAHAGVFAVLLPREYCLIWEAGRSGAIVDYRIRLRTAGN